MPRPPRLTLLLCTLAALSGCATLHHVQVDDIDSSGGPLQPFELRVSEAGVSVMQAGAIGAVGARLAGATAGQAKHVLRGATAVSLFQLGPKTGYPSFDDRYADGVRDAVLAVCPSGRVTGLLAVREAVSYPVFSGEAVRIKGYCAP